MHVSCVACRFHLDSVDSAGSSIAKARVPVLRAVAASPASGSGDAVAVAA